MDKTRDNDSCSSEFGEFPFKKQEPPPSPPSSPPQRKHFCEMCNRQFSSDKAYGSHVRSHSDRKGKTKKISGVRGEDDNNLLHLPPPSPPPPQLSPPPQRKYFCMICNRQFDSHQGYGGHMRTHSNSKGKTKKKEIDTSMADVESKIYTCHRCGQEFERRRYLFGHMRTHLDRNCKVLEDDDSDNDDDEYEDAWNRHMLISNATEDVKKAACCLMTMRSI